MKHFTIALSLVLMASACKPAAKKESNEVSNETKQEHMELSNKEKAIALLVSLETGDQTPVSFINPTNYKQHNLGVADGLEGFGDVLKHAPEGGFKAKVVRAYEDGDYVFTHTIYDFFGPKIGFDIFKFENGKIVEHWDNLIEIAPNNPSGHSQTDGPIDAVDVNKTEANKTLVSDFITTILVNGEMNKLSNYFNGDNYIQHNPAIGDGLSGLGAALEAMAKQGVSMVFTETHKVLGEGNFVLAVSEGTFAGQPTSYYDLFRVADGKIAEHWDVMESIMPEADRKNNNGKFNF